MYHTITIQSLRQKIQSWNNELGKTQDPFPTIVSTVAPVPVSTDSSTSDTRGQYDMDIFKRKIQFIEYQKTTAKNKKEIKSVSRPPIIYSSTEELVNSMDPTPFLKPWFRLDMYLKKVKVREYVDEHIKNGTLSGSAEDYLSTLYEHIHNKQLNTQKEVDYDSSEGRILQIYSLHPKEAKTTSKKKKTEALSGSI